MLHNSLTESIERRRLDSAMAKVRLAWRVTARLLQLISNVHAPRQLSEVWYRFQQLVIARVVYKSRNWKRVLWMEDVRVRRVIYDDGLSQVSPQAR